MLDLCKCSNDKFIFDQTSDANQVIFKVSDFGTEENPIYATVNLDPVLGGMMRLEVCVNDNNGRPYVEWESEVCEKEDFLCLEHSVKDEYLTVYFTTNKNILWAKMVGFDSCDSGVAMIHSRHLNDVLNMGSELLWSA
jgi:hypothetical protein